MSKQVILNSEKRISAILAAALKCFLHFGYVKTSMDDIAKEACLSRPLLYLKFKNKEDLFIGVFGYLTQGRYERAIEVLQTNDSKKNKLLKIFDILVLEPWDQIIGKPMSGDFYDACSRVFPEVPKKYKQQILKCTQALLEEEAAKVFILSFTGLQSDLPKTAVLKRRLAILVDRFIYQPTS
jgi:AcrR family transcriptional regulator